MPLSAFRMTQGIDSEVQWSSSTASSRVMARWAGTPEAQLLLPSTGGGGRVWGGGGGLCVSGGSAPIALSWVRRGSRQVSTMAGPNAL